MKKLLFAMALCTFTTGALFTGCNTPAGKVDDAQENVIQANKELEQANQDYLADMASFRKQTADKIAANEKAIAESNARLAKEKATVRADRKKKIAELEQRNRTMKAKLENFKEGGKEEWMKFKTEFNHDMDELGKAFKDLTVNNVR